MDSQTLFKVFIGALICAAIVFSVVVGICVYYASVSIFEIAEALTSGETTTVRVYILEGGV